MQVFAELVISQIFGYSEFQFQTCSGFVLFVQANVVLGFLVQTLVDFLVVQVHFDLEFLVEDAAFDNHEFLLQAFADHEMLVQIFVDLVFLVQAFVDF